MSKLWLKKGSIFSQFRHRSCGQSHSLLPKSPRKTFHIVPALKLWLFITNCSEYLGSKWILDLWKQQLTRNTVFPCSNFQCFRALSGCMAGSKFIFDFGKGSCQNSFNLKVHLTAVLVPNHRLMKILWHFWKIQNSFQMDLDVTNNLRYFLNNLKCLKCNP